MVDHSLVTAVALGGRNPSCNLQTVAAATRRRRSKPPCPTRLDTRCAGPPRSPTRASLPAAHPDRKPENGPILRYGQLVEVLSAVTITIVAHTAAKGLEQVVRPPLMKGWDENRRWFPRADRQFFVVVIDDRRTAIYRNKNVPRKRENLGRELPGRYAVPRVGHVASIRFTSIFMVARDIEKNIVIPRFGAGYLNRSD